MRNAALCLLALIVASTSAEPVDEPAESPSWFARLLPEKIHLGPQMGMTASRFQATSQYRAMVMPTAANGDAWMSPSYGALISGRWRKAFTLTLAPRMETYGMDTREETVYFPENPFPHTLESSTRTKYLVWPLLMGMGWFGARQHFQVQLGTYAAQLQQAEIRWVVDGETYPNRPGAALFKKNPTGWIFGIEYGARMGPGTMLLGFGTQRGFGSLMEGLPGNIKAESAGMNLAYVWRLGGR